MSTEFLLELGLKMSGRDPRNSRARIKTLARLSPAAPRGSPFS